MNPVFININGFEIKYYSLFLLIGAILGSFLILREAKRFKLPEEFVTNIIFWGIIFGFIGARIYYVLFNIEYYKLNKLDIFKVWEGGLAIHGGIIFGALFVFFYTKKYKARFLRYSDLLVPGLIIGQIIGRWGNFFNSEAHGAATTIETLTKLKVPEFIIDGMNINGVYYMPAFYFESLMLLIVLFGFLFIRRGKYTKVGTVSGLYLVAYGIIRFFIEISRTDALLIGDYKVAQIMSILMFISGTALLINNFKKGRFEDLYNDKDNIEKIRF